MSKRELRKYLKELTKVQLEDQIIDLYERFKPVKEYYDFAFNPKENELIEQCRFQISKEYYPIGSRKAKMRRSVAQKWIKKLMLFDADASLLADVMFFNIEIALSFSGEHIIRQESFFTSMYKSFDETLRFVSEKGILAEFKGRIEKIAGDTCDQKWPNSNAFEDLADMYLG
jgi:transcriptional regulator with PAS, ATPase and Fis domain